MALILENIAIISKYLKSAKVNYTGNNMYSIIIRDLYVNVLIDEHLYDLELMTMVRFAFKEKYGVDILKTTLEHNLKRLNDKETYKEEDIEWL
jgi:hypothetical protein